LITLIYLTSIALEGNRRKLEMLKRNISDLYEAIRIIEDVTHGLFDMETIKLMDVRYVLDLYIKEKGTIHWCKRKSKSEYRYEVEYEFEDEDATIVDELEAYVLECFSKILFFGDCSDEDLAELY